MPNADSIPATETLTILTEREMLMRERDEARDAALREAEEVARAEERSTPHGPDFWAGWRAAAKDIANAIASLRAAPPAPEPAEVGGEQEAENA